MKPGACALKPDCFHLARVRDALIRKARQAETGSYMSEWLSSRSLDSPEDNAVSLMVATWGRSLGRLVLAAYSTSRSPGKVRSVANRVSLPDQLAYDARDLRYRIWFCHKVAAFGQVALFDFSHDLKGLQRS